MALVSTVSDLEENISLFERFLCEGSEDEQHSCLSLIGAGRCFVAYEAEREFRFAPSRYIGYKSNTPKKHASRKNNGTETNSAINRTLKIKPLPDQELENLYQKFCQAIGAEPQTRERKFWLLNTEQRKFSTGWIGSCEFPEGAIVERLHRVRERNSELINEAKSRFIEKYNRLFCQICEFDFESVYGGRGKGYIEGHHNIPVSKMRPGEKTNLSDIVMVCSNCHKIIHRTRPWLSAKELAELIK